MKMIICLMLVALSVGQPWVADPRTSARGTQAPARCTLIFCRTQARRTCIDDQIQDLSCRVERTQACLRRCGFAGPVQRVNGRGLTRAERALIAANANLRTALRLFSLRSAVAQQALANDEAARGTTEPPTTSATEQFPNTRPPVTPVTAFTATDSNPFAAWRGTNVPAAVRAQQARGQTLRQKIVRARARRQAKKERGAKAAESKKAARRRAAQRVARAREKRAARRRARRKKQAAQRKLRAARRRRQIVAELRRRKAEARKEARMARRQLQRERQLAREKEEQRKKKQQRMKAQRVEESGDLREDGTGDEHDTEEMKSPVEAEKAHLQEELSALRQQQASCDGDSSCLDAITDVIRSVQHSLHNLQQ